MAMHKAMTIYVLTPWLTLCGLPARVLLSALTPSLTLGIGAVTIPVVTLSVVMSTAHVSGRLTPSRLRFCK